MMSINGFNIPNEAQRFVIDVLWPVLLVHEVWLCLQHSNILLNPLCQRLDRNYGIALYENNMAWVISFTLSAYWAREILSMALCFLLVTSPLTRTVVKVSCGYHVFKIVSVNIDAWRKWSPKLGVMRLLLDYWHFDTIVNCLISLKRIFLQGFDTVTHALVIHDLLYSANAPDNSWFLMYATTILWTIHALAVQITRKSTASLMVEFYTRMSVFLGLVNPRLSLKDLQQQHQLVADESDAESKSTRKRDQTWKDFFCGPHFHMKPIGEKGCKVCRMLSKPTTNDSFAASSMMYTHSSSSPVSTTAVGVSIQHTAAAGGGHIAAPDVVFLAHLLQLSSAFAWWLSPKQGTARARSLSISTATAHKSDEAWRPSRWMESSLMTFFVGLLSATCIPLGSFFGGSAAAAFVVDRCRLEPFRGSQLCGSSFPDQPLSSSASATSTATTEKKSESSRRKKNVASLAKRRSDVEDGTGIEAAEGAAVNTLSNVPLTAADSITAEVWLTKVFAWQYVATDPFGFWKSYARNAVIRSAKHARERGCRVFGLGALNKAHFLNRGGEDLLQALLEDGEDCGSPSSGNSGSKAGGLDDQQSSSSLLDDLEAGLQNKPSSLFSPSPLGGGCGRMCIVHGNTLTAAVVLEHIKRLLNLRKASPRSQPSMHHTETEIILTGATSKIGRAIAVKLATMNIRTLCIGTDSTRMRDVLIECDTISRAIVKQESKKGGPKKRQVVLPHAAVVQYASIADAGERASSDAIWIIGKYDNPKELLETIPLGASVLSFAVPCPLRKSNGDLLRDDLQFIDAGVMIVPETYEQQRQFSVLLPRRLVFACHAAAIVHCMEGWTHHEVGEVDIDNMQKTMDAAHKHGFTIDYTALSMPPAHIDPTDEAEADADGIYDAVVIGCGPSGLATGAALKRQGQGGVKHLAMLDQHSDIEGQWRSQYEGLTLTTRGQHNALPFFPIPRQLFGQQNNDHTISGTWDVDDSNSCKISKKPNFDKPIGQSEVTAEGYIRYLNLYARRMGLTQHIRLGSKVVKVVRVAGLTSADHNERGRNGNSNESHLTPDQGIWEVHYETIGTLRNESDTNTLGTSTPGNGSNNKEDASRAGGGGYVYRGILLCRNVIVASGKASIPACEEELLRKLSDFKGRVISAKDVTNVRDVAAEETILLVGAGNSALDLSDALIRTRYALGKVLCKVTGGAAVAVAAAGGGGGGAVPVLHISMRSIPPVLPRQWLCLSIEGLSSRIFKYLPQIAVDTIAWFFYRFLHATSSYTDKLPGRKRNPDWLPRSSRRVPPIDKYGFVDAVRRGLISVHSTIERVEGKTIYFSNGDDEKFLDNVDVIVLCTGYEADFSWLHLDGLATTAGVSPSVRTTETAASKHSLANMAKQRSREPAMACRDGLYFVGYDPGDAVIPIMGIREQAISIAREVKYAREKL